MRLDKHMGTTITIYGRTKEPHTFARRDCIICHVDAEKDFSKLKTIQNSLCEKCHKKQQTQSHPIGVIPITAIPVDMPLVNGRLACVTCHFVHPASISNKRYNYFLLRRPGRGPVFCSSCHGIDERTHVILESGHQSSSTVAGRKYELDLYSLQCLDCHDEYLNSLASTSAGRQSSIYKTDWNHPIGVSYAETARKKPNSFKPPEEVNNALRFFDGNIGCGTCHNVYSKEKFMLVVNNKRSRLCLECHNK